MTGPASPVWRRTTHALLLAAATVSGLAAIHWLRTHQAGYGDKFFPIVHAGTLKQRVQARNFAVEVTGRRLASVIRVKPDAADMPIRLKGDRNGIWLPLAVKVEALQTNGIVGAQLQARDGRVFTSTGPERPKLDGTNMAAFALTPGLPRTGVYFFWIPNDALEGLHAQFFWGPGDVEPWDSLVDIDLDIGDAAKVQALQDDALPMLDTFQ